MFIFTIGDVYIRILHICLPIISCTGLYCNIKCNVMEIDEWGNQSSHFIRVHLSKETTEQTEENKIIKDKKKKGGNV